MRLSQWSICREAGRILSPARGTVRMGGGAWTKRQENFYPKAAKPSHSVTNIIYSKELHHSNHQNLRPLMRLELPGLFLYQANHKSRLFSLRFCFLIITGLCGRTELALGLENLLKKKPPLGP